MRIMLGLLLATLLAPGAFAADGPKKVVFIAGEGHHGDDAHRHHEGNAILAAALRESGLGFETVEYDGWPKDPAAFDGAATVVIYANGGGGHPVISHLDAFDGLMKKGVGVVLLHYAVEVPKGPAGDKFLDWTGGYFELEWSVNPHWVAKFESLPEHPTTRGVKPFELDDEWYYHMRFRPEMEGVAPLLSAHPPKNTLDRPDGPHSGNPFVRKAVAAGEIQHLAWARQRPESEGGGRGFGCTGGHWHSIWKNDDYRTFILNAIAWTAGAEVPAGGVPSATPEK